jgi:hypothetical protein
MPFSTKVTLRFWVRRPGAGHGTNWIGSEAFRVQVLWFFENDYGNKYGYHRRFNAIDTKIVVVGGNLHRLAEGCSPLVQLGLPGAAARGDGRVLQVLLGELGGERTGRSGPVRILTSLPPIDEYR